MRIAYASIHDATTIATGFGIFNSSAYLLGRALNQAGAQVDFLGPLRETYGPWYWAKQVYHREITHKTYNRHRETRPIRDFSRQIAARLARGNHDIVLSPLSPGSQPVAYLQCRQPIVICTDSTLASAVQNYPALSWSASVQSNLRAGLENEAAALARARLILYPSKWAAQAAIAQYRLDAAKVKVIPWGPGFECNRRFSDIEWMVENRPADVCRILFVGWDWERKGGPIVLATVRELRRRGVNVELDIVGNRAVEAQSSGLDFVRIHGPLHRSDSGQSALLDELYARSHLYFMPSRGEAFGLVFAEASSFALPSIATKVGGLPEVIREGVNGFTFPLDTGPAGYADAIQRIVADRDTYRKLAFSTFSEFETRLNWRTAINQMLHEMQSLLSSDPRLPRARAA